MYKSLWIGIRIPSVYISLLWFVCVYIILNMASISRLIYRLICAAVTLLSTALQFVYYRMIPRSRTESYILLYRILLEVVGTNG